MLSFSAFWAILRGGSKGYPFLAYSRIQTTFQRRKGLIPKVFVVLDTDRGCQRITYSQAEFAAQYRL